MVILPLRFSTNSNNLFSFILSNELAASSNIKIFGLFTKALAMHNLCFCPPDNFEPLCPTK